MRKFSFKLNGLLVLRKSEEQEALQVYANKVKERERLNGQYEMIIQEWARITKEQRLSRDADFSAKSQLNLQNSLDYINSELFEVKERLSLALDAEKKALMSYFSKKTKRKALEVLKDKKYLGFKKDRLKKELKIIDDIVNARKVLL